jgi:signal transduction histidine kinase
MLTIAGLLTIGTVAAVGVVQLHRDGGPWFIAAVLLLAFLVMQLFESRFRDTLRQSLLYLVVQTSLVVGLLLIGQPVGLFVLLFFILSAQATIMLPGAAGLAWIGLIILVTAAMLIYWWGPSNGLLSLPAYAGGFFFFGMFARALMRADAARRESQRLLDDLQEAHRQLQASAERIEELAVAEERNRLAREMHDTLGHRLTVAAVQLEGAQRLIPADPDRAADMVGTVRQQVREALGELRYTVAALRAPLEEDLHLRSALQRLASRFEEATGLTVHQVLPEEKPDLPQAQRLVLYRAAQEALTNVQRHAQASQVWLVLSVQDGAASILVSDDGIGFSPGAANGSGLGLHGLRERAQQLSGELHLEARPGGGAQLSLRLPLPNSVQPSPPETKPPGTSSDLEHVQGQSDTKVKPPTSVRGM